MDQTIRETKFRQASGLSSKGEESQVNTLIYTMGDKADDILSSFGLSEENQKKYSVVREKFENHFVKRRNVIFERARFNSRKQLQDRGQIPRMQAGIGVLINKDFPETIQEVHHKTNVQDETVDSFITDLFCLAEHCAYEQLRDEMIRDRLVVGLRDASLSEKMQLDPELTLDKAMAMARQSEAVHKQQPMVRGTQQQDTPTIEQEKIDTLSYRNPKNASRYRRADKQRLPRNNPGGAVTPQVVPRHNRSGRTIYGKCGCHRWSPLPQVVPPEIFLCTPSTGLYEEF